MRPLSYQIDEYECWSAFESACSQEKFWYEYVLKDSRRHYVVYKFCVSHAIREVNPSTALGTFPSDDLKFLHFCRADKKFEVSDDHI